MSSASISYLATASIVCGVLDTYVFKNAPPNTTEKEKVDASRAMDAVLIALIDGSSPFLIFRENGEAVSHPLCRTLGLHSLQGLTRFCASNYARDLQSWPEQRQHIQSCDLVQLQSDMFELQMWGWDVPPPNTREERTAILNETKSEENFRSGVEALCKQLAAKTGEVAKAEWKRDAVVFLDSVFGSDAALE